MKPIREQLLLYAITDRSWVGRQTLYEQIEDALKGGVTLVQLREKGLDQAEFLREALQVKDLCHRYGVPLIINDNVDVALGSGADGVHVGMEDAPVAAIRAKAPAGFLIGATAKTVDQARAAENYRYFVCKNKVLGWFRRGKARWQDRKTHRYFRCPQCRATVRVPRGKGKIRITCPKCKHQFVKKS